MHILFILALLLAGLLLQTMAQFMTRDEYQKAQREKELDGRMNALEELEAEVRAEGFSLYKVASDIIDARDEETGLTKLMVYATRGIKDECKHLIVQGANLELTNRLGETALLIAIAKGNYHSAAELLKGHANMHHRSTLGLNALHTAIAASLPSLVEAVLRTDSSWRDGVWGKQYTRPPLVDTRLETGMTPLMMCAQDGEMDMAKSLLEYGAQVNLKSPTGETALMYSSITGEIDLVKILLRNGADPGAVNNYGYTAAIMAANRGHMDVLRRFVVYDEDYPNTGFLDIQDPSGHNALDHALLSNEKEAVELLMAAGAAAGKIHANVGKEVLERRTAALERKRLERKRELERTAEKPLYEL